MSLGGAPPQRAGRGSMIRVVVLGVFLASPTPSGVLGVDPRELAEQLVRESHKDVAFLNHVSSSFGNTFPLENDDSGKIISSTTLIVNGTHRSRIGCANALHVSTTWDVQTSPEPGGPQQAAQMSIRTYAPVFYAPIVSDSSDDTHGEAADHRERVKGALTAAFQADKTVAQHVRQLQSVLKPRGAGNSGKFEFRLFIGIYVTLNLTR